VGIIILRWRRNILSAVNYIVKLGNYIVKGGRSGNYNVEMKEEYIVGWSENILSSWKI
jgi:hypothetical protein